MPIARSPSHALGFRLMGLAYLAAGVGFFFLESQALYLMNFLSGLLPSLQLTDVPATTGKFWLIPGVTLYVVSSFLCFATAQFPARRTFPGLLLTANAVSAALYWYLFQREERQVGYWLGVILDASVAVLALFGVLHAIARRTTARNLADLTETQEITRP